MTNWRIEARALGTPRPQGSKTYLSKGHARESSDYLPGWRSDVVDAVRRALPEGWTTHVGAVLVLLDFAMPRPRYLVGKPTPPHLGKPDADKLTRAVFDACKTAGLVRDDGQFTSAYVVKRYADDDEDPGVRMVFTPGC